MTNPLEVPTAPPGTGCRRTTVAPRGSSRTLTARLLPPALFALLIGATTACGAVGAASTSTSTASTTAATAASTTAVAPPLSAAASASTPTAPPVSSSSSTSPKSSTSAASSASATAAPAQPVLRRTTSATPTTTAAPTSTTRTFPAGVTSAVTPFFPDGRVRLALSADRPTATNCAPSPVAEVPGVYQCGTTAADLVACWPDPAGSPELYCLHQPTDTTVVRIPKPATLPAAPGDPQAEPWLVTLADGGDCAVRVGGAWPVPPAGYRYTDSCQGATVAALVTRTGRPTVDTSTTPWSAEGTRTLTDRPAVVPVAVTGTIVPGAAPTVAPASTGNSCPSPAQILALLPKGSYLEGSKRISCVGDWATTLFNEAGDATVGLFQKIDGRWTVQSRATQCRMPSPIPAALFQDNCLID
jgi:hypothetical protein